MNAPLTVRAKDKVVEIGLLVLEAIVKGLPKHRVVTGKWVYTVTDARTLALGQPDVT